MKKLILSLLKYLILPFALLYGFIVFIRNKMYDWNLISSIEFSLPVICVGNITVGGTGKSPHIEYLIELLSPYYQMATLSRGYRRYTRGFHSLMHNQMPEILATNPFNLNQNTPK
ncbi:MAG: tetraacyldisaccharide 4'-kinase [Bacteroidetes bacterium]|nr:tetraacyldisaccharide 4'-kinase [Bacteroidota bacterium]